MARITTNAHKLPIPTKLSKGATIISMSTDNPNVPGNEAALAAFAAAQAELEQTTMDEMAVRSELMAKMTARDRAVANWLEQLNGLAAFTMSATGADAGKILSSGFEVRRGRTATQRLPAPVAVVARLNGKPGHTELSWPPVEGAKCYLLQRCHDLKSGEWEFAGTVTKAKADLNGAQPGQQCWYRLAAVNGKGQGPWSGPVARPVL